MNRGTSKPIVIFAAGTLAVAGLGCYVWHESSRPPLLEIHVFDTPGRPSVFMRTPDDRRILYGGGSNTDIIRRLSSILPFYSRRIDTVIVPDTDAKNVIGLIGLVDRYSVGRAVVPSETLVSLGLASSSDPAYEALGEALRSRSIPVMYASAGDMLTLGQGVEARVLFPLSPQAFRYSKASGPGILLKVTYGSTEVLLTAGSSAKIQKALASGMSHADALVVSHGSAPANFTAELMNAARPDSLVYSEAVRKPSRSSPSSAKKKKPQADPLAGILNGRRFNVQERGVVRIVSDGLEIDIK